MISFYRLWSNKATTNPKEEMTMPNERIEFAMTNMQIAMVLSEGNACALQACVDLIRQCAKIDPDDDCNRKGMGSLVLLDKMNIYGKDIWSLYHDVCGEDIAKLIALCRASQLQLAGVNEEAIKGAIRMRGKFDFDKVIAAVQKELPNFNRSEESSASETTDN